jgi:hypothetical protein
MFGTKANKIGKRRGGILSVFSKTITELEKLDSETATQIDKQTKKIKKEELERAALKLEQKQINKTVGKMKSVLGLDEDEVEIPEIKAIPPTEN